MAPSWERVVLRRVSAGVVGVCQSQFTLPSAGPAPIVPVFTFTLSGEATYVHYDPYQSCFMSRKTKFKTKLRQRNTDEGAGWARVEGDAVNENPPPDSPPFWRDSAKDTWRW